MYDNAAEIRSLLLAAEKAAEGGSNDAEISAWQEVGDAVRRYFDWTDEPGDRGFLHDVAYHLGVVSVTRVEEEDGNPAEEGKEIARITASEIPNFDPDTEESSWYFETDPDLPAWLSAWAWPIIDASKNTDEYRQHAAEWIGPDGDWT